jgi:hypothetical protein
MPDTTLTRYLARLHGWVCNLLHAKKQLKKESLGADTLLPQQVEIDSPSKELMSFNQITAIPEKYFRRLMLNKDSLVSTLSVIANDKSLFKTVANIYSIYRINDSLSALTDEQKIIGDLVFDFMPELSGKESVLIDILSNSDVIKLSLNAGIHEGDSLLVALIKAVQNNYLHCLSIFSVSGNHQVFDFLASHMLKHCGPIHFADFSNNINIENDEKIFNETELFHRVVVFVSNLPEIDKSSLMPHLNGTLKRRIIEENLFL